MRTHNLRSKRGDFQYFPCFCFIHEALWMQNFVLLQPMWHLERSNLSDSRTFQSWKMEGGLMRKNMKFQSLQKYFLKVLYLSFEIKKNTCCRRLQKWSQTELCSTPPIPSPSLWFYQNFLIDPFKDSHMKLATISAKLQALGLQFSFLRFFDTFQRYFPAFQVVLLVKYPVLSILGKCLMDS